MLLAILRRDFVPRHASLRALEYLRGRHINLVYAGTIAALEMILPGTSIPSILVDSRLNPLMMAKMVSQGFGEFSDGLLKYVIRCFCDHVQPDSPLRRRQHRSRVDHSAPIPWRVIRPDLFLTSYPVHFF